MFRVLGAIVFAAGLIGAAFFVGRNDTSDALAEIPAVVVARGDVRTVQPAIDTDEDGIPDWEEQLRGTDPHTYTMLATTTPQTPEEPYMPPATVTGQFAEQFLETVVRNGAGKDLTAEEQAAIVNQSIGTLEAETRDTLYTLADIKSIVQNDLAALRTYGNEVGGALMRNSIKNENEFIILERAVTQNNPDELKALGPIKHAYGGMIRSLLALETPTNVAKQHVDLINTLSMVQADIVAMENAFTDPLAALVRIKRYKDDAAGLFYAIDNIRLALEARGIVYTSDEPGIFLFSFRP